MGIETSSYNPRKNENIRFFSHGTNDGHGGRAAEHHEEMKAIAEQVVQIQVPIIAAQIFNEAIDKAIGAITYDIKTIVSVSFDEADGIFKSEKYRQFVSDRIVREIKANLEKQKIKLSL